jgi:hypothetical protein
MKKWSNALCDFHKAAELKPGYEAALFNQDKAFGRLLMEIGVLMLHASPY